MDFFVHNMAPIMFGSLVLFLILGYPVAFALAANGLFFGLIGARPRPVPAPTSSRPCLSASTAS